MENGPFEDVFPIKNGDMPLLFFEFAPRIVLGEMIPNFTSSYFSKMVGKKPPTIRESFGMFVSVFL